jgi:hypothetical protein
VPAEEATPALARRAAAAHPGRCAALCRERQLPPLLRFALSDLDLALPGGVSELLGVPLLPLADGRSVAAAGPLEGAGAEAAGRVYVTADALELALVGSQGGLARLYIYVSVFYVCCHV